MKSYIKHPIVVAFTVLTLFAATQTRASVTYDTPSGSLDSANENINAQAIFTLGNGTLTIQLINLQADPTSAGQLLSGISFDISGSTSSGNLATANSGLITTINSGGSYAPGTADSLTRWKAKETGSAINLTGLGGGQPDHLIIGPDSTNGFAGLGKYDQANASIYNFLPVVLGSGLFTITVNGITTNSVLSDVDFEFGTQPDTTITGQALPPAPSPVPEPTTIVSGALLVLPFGISVLRQLRNRRQSA